MSLLSAYVGVSGLADMGYRFYNVDETVNGARITAGIVDGGNGWYSVNATIPGGATSVRWDSTGTPTAIAREYFYDYADPPGVTTLLSRVPNSIATELSTYGALKPTVAGRTLDITATGEAGIDLDNTVGTLAKGTDLTGFNDIAAGTAMTLTSAYDAAKTASSQASNDQIYTVVDTEVAAIKAKTDQLNFTGSNVQATVTISAGDLIAIADAILKRDFSAVSGESARSLINAARFLRNKWSVSGTTLTVTKEDDAASAWTATVTKDAASAPVVASDPA